MKSLILISFLFLIHLVHASTCSGKGKLTQEEYNETALIFSAEITHVEFDSTTYVRQFIMQIHNVFKGDLDTTMLKVYTKGRLSASYLEKGDKMLLFLNLHEGVPFVTKCSRQYYLEEFSRTPALKELVDILNRQDGVFEEYHLNDTLRSIGEINNRLPVGEWKYFDNEGKLKKEGAYLNGKKTGLWKETYNGVWHSQNYINGIKNGIYFEYFKDGTLKQTGLYVNDLKTGVWTSYYQNGAPKEQKDKTNKSYFYHSWDPDGNFMVKKGNGVNKHFDDNGNPEKYSDSEIENGTWK